MPEVKEAIPEKGSPQGSIFEIMEAASEAQCLLYSLYSLYTAVRDRDTNIPLEAIATAISALYEKTEDLLKKIQQTADELRPAVA